MKTLFYTKTLIALAVAIAAAASAVSQAQEQPIPPPAAESAAPVNIVPGTPLAEVVKMLQAGVDLSTIQSYIANSQGAFNLDADKIIFLKDEGLPSDLINVMLERDKSFYASSVIPPQPTTAVTTVSTVETAAPTAPVTINYFNNTLSPYGSWVEVDGYGRCWRPTAVVYDTGWRPYCDRGHWVYTDCGWYWDSDYSWGVTFHYGRWFNNPRFGWCWYPDTEWAPSWVTWRSGGDYCGWAPLPPLAVFRPGLGFYFRGVSVGFDFDFGLRADCFTFVAPGRFCDRHPRTFCVQPQYITQVYRQTTVINNYTVNKNTIVNHGISVDRIRQDTHRSIEAVHVNNLPNAARQGWRGEGFEQNAQRRNIAGTSAHNTINGRNNNDNHNNDNRNSTRTVTSGNSGNAGNGQLRHGPETGDNKRNKNNDNHVNSGMNTAHPGTAIQAGQGAPGAQGGHVAEPARTTPQIRSTGTDRTAKTYSYQPQQSQQSQPVQQSQLQTRRIESQAPQYSAAARNQALQNRGFNTPPTGSSSQQHGAEQLQQRQFINPPLRAQATPQVRQTVNPNYAQSANRGASAPAPAVSTAPAQAHSAGNAAVSAGGNSSGGAAGGASSGGGGRSNDRHGH